MNATFFALTKNVEKSLLVYIFAFYSTLEHCYVYMYNFPLNSTFYLNSLSLFSTTFILALFSLRRIFLLLRLKGKKFLLLYCFWRSYGSLWLPKQQFECSVVFISFFLYIPIAHCWSLQFCVIAVAGDFFNSLLFCISGKAIHIYITETQILAACIRFQLRSCSHTHLLLLLVEFRYLFALALAEKYKEETNGCFSFCLLNHCVGSCCCYIL